MFGLGLLINYDIDPGLGGRYALSMAPLLIVVLAASVEGKWALAAWSRSPAASLVATFVAMVS